MFFVPYCMVSVHECIYKPNVWNRVNCVQNTIRECDLTEACFFKVNFPVYQKCALFAGMWPDRSLPTEGATTWFTKVHLFTQPLLMWLWIKDFFQKIAFHRFTFPPLILACLPYCVNKSEQTNKQVSALSIFQQTHSDEFSWREAPSEVEWLPWEY